MGNRITLNHSSRIIQAFTIVVILSALDTLGFRSAFPNGTSNLLNHSVPEYKTIIKYDSVSSENLITSIDILPDSNCNIQLRDFMLEDLDLLISIDEFQDKYGFRNSNPNCHWSAITLYNPYPWPIRRVLNFAESWPEVDCFLSLKNGYMLNKKVGQLHEKVISVTIDANESLLLYAYFPPANDYGYSSLRTWERSESNYYNLVQRSRYKFMMLGLLLFPIFFFLARFIIDKERLNLYFLIFLIGAFIHLITIVDKLSFFSFSTDLITSNNTLQRFFIVSVAMILYGLMKYIHLLLNVDNWQKPIFKTGYLLLGVFIVIAILPFIYSPLFKADSYYHYLQYFRLAALLVFVYILIACIYATVYNVRFSLLVLLAFTPFLVSVIIYAISFMIKRINSSNDIESFILLTGFFSSIFLFGLVLGARNSAIKADKFLLEQKTLRLQELDRFKNRFYINFTHEFRTPLTIISGFTAEITGHETIKKIIKDNTQKLLKMVNELLDLSKLESGKLSINWKRGDIIPFLKYLTESCTSLAIQKRILLTFESSEDCLYMDYDNVMIEQIIINLLSNAIKFTAGDGQVQVIVSKLKEEGKELLEILVKDSGCGIEKVHLDHIFDRFYQVDDSDSRDHEGSGIGLALVNELVQLLEGRIEVESMIGYGSTFKVCLPIHIDARLPYPKSNLMQFEQVSWNEEDQDEINKNTRVPNVLLIEDNQDLVKYICYCLKGDFNVTFAHNGKEGVEKAQKTVPDVVISDIMMPEMDGFEVCRLLKTTRSTSHIPILILTAKVTQEDKVAGLKLGADAFLTKPFDKEELKIRLANLAAVSLQLRQQIRSNLEDFEQDIKVNESEINFVKEVDRIILDKISDESFNTNQFCREIGMSRTQLHRKLTALTGISTATYIRNKRMHRAKHLIQNTNLPIGEVAFQVGYKDFSHFSRTFTQEFGRNPSSMRI